MVALADGRGEVAGDALAVGTGLAPRLGLGDAGQSGGVDGLALAWATPDDVGGEADASGRAGVAASPVRVTTSTRTHAPKTAAQRGRR